MVPVTKFYGLKRRSAVFGCNSRITSGFAFKLIPNFWYAGYWILFVERTIGSGTVSSFVFGDTGPVRTRFNSSGRSSAV